MSATDEMLKVMVDVLTTKIDFCFCGNPKNKIDLYCSGCEQERYAERKKFEREYAREIYGPDSAQY